MDLPGIRNKSDWHYKLALHLKNDEDLVKCIASAC